MSKIELVSEEPWSFSVYRIDDFYALEIEFYEGITDYIICYKLLDNDVSHIDDIDYFKELTNSIRENKDLYTDRVINPISWWKNN